MAIAAVSFYLVAYTVTTLVAFGIVTASLRLPDRDAEDLEDYRGLFWRRPVMAGVFTVCIAFTRRHSRHDGFSGQVLCARRGSGRRRLALIIILVVTSVAGLFYYLRIVVALYADTTERDIPVLPVSRSATLVLAVLALLLIWFGVYPTPLLNLIRTITA